MWPKVCRHLQTFHFGMDVNMLLQQPFSQIQLQQHYWRWVLKPGFQFASQRLWIALTAPGKRTQNYAYTILLALFCIISLPLLLFASPLNPSICLSPVSPCHSSSDSFHLIHPQPALDPPPLDTLTRAHISCTDCLSSIFCSTLHHSTNRWITFLAPELCTNIS